METKLKCEKCDLVETHPVAVTYGWHTHDDRGKKVIHLMYPEGPPTSDARWDCVSEGQKKCSPERMYNTHKECGWVSE